MKLRTRLAVSFLTVTVVPMLLICMAILGLNSYQSNLIRKTYGLTNQTNLLSGNSMQVFNRLTEASQDKIRETMENDPGLFEDMEYLEELNETMLTKYAYTIVRKGDELIYVGNTKAGETEFYDQLPE